jgi:hypothetical protein
VYSSVGAHHRVYTMNNCVTATVHTGRGGPSQGNPEGSERGTGGADK